MNNKLNGIYSKFWYPNTVTTVNKSKHLEVVLMYDLREDMRADLVKSVMDFGSIEYQYYNSKAVWMIAKFKVRLPKSDTSVLLGALPTSKQEDQSNQYVDGEWNQIIDGEVWSE